jgi:cell division septation protein DedD
MRSALSVLFVAAVLVTASGCSRENQDWRSAQAADTVEGYDDFVAKHPQSEFAGQAKSRVKQLAEERDWERATAADNAEAYQQFLTQHPEGKWAQEARIRIENFNVLDGGAAKPAATAATAGGTPAPAAAAKAAAAVKPSAAPQATAATAPKAAAAKAAAPAAPAARAARAAAATKAPAAKPAVAKATAAPKAPAPKAAATAAAPKHAAAATGDHLIQLGAFSTESKADAEWKRVSGAYGDLKGLSPHVVAAQTSAGKLYRLQVTVPSEDRGRAICNALAASKQACVYVRH